MIIKMIILRLLGSSDDKKKEKIGVARPKGPPLRGFRPDGPRKGIGALAGLCTRDDVKYPGEDPSAPVQPMVHRCIPSVQ